MNTEQRVREIVSHITGSTHFNDWDSIDHFNILITLEQEFGVQFDSHEVPMLASVDALVERITPTKKCIVVDLDNTLWSGVLGEDGVEGLAFPEELFNLQFYLAELQSRGWLLAIASKNDQEEAALVFTERYSEMALHHLHFFATRIGWQDKCVSVQQIAKQLHIGLDTVLFLDDSPYEREQMMSALPDVGVVDLSGPPEGWVNRLQEAIGIQRTVTDEDRLRTQFMRDDNVRRLEQERHPEKYLETLGQILTVEELGPENLARAAQLCQRTNQFNLTLNRSTEHHLREWLEEEEHVGLVFSVRDRLGDAGRVGFVLGLPSSIYGNGRYYIYEFVLSCRAIGRGIELGMMAVLLENLRGRHWIYSLNAECKHGPRNQPCRTLLADCGFSGGSRIVVEPMVVPSYLTVQKESPSEVDGLMGE